jgi:hypothetical protein
VARTALTNMRSPLRLAWCRARQDRLQRNADVAAAYLAEQLLTIDATLGELSADPRVRQALVLVEQRRSVLQQRAELAETCRALGLAQPRSIVKGTE